MKLKIKFAIEKSKNSVTYNIVFRLLLKALKYHNLTRVIDLTRVYRKCLLIMAETLKD